MKVTGAERGGAASGSPRRRAAERVMARRFYSCRLKEVEVTRRGGVGWTRSLPALTFYRPQQQQERQQRGFIERGGVVLTAPLRDTGERGNPTS